MNLSPAQLEHHRQRVLADVPSAHQLEFGRLSKNLLYGGEHLFLFFICQDQLLRDQLCTLIKKLLAPLKHSDATIDLLSDPPSSIETFSAKLREYKDKTKLLHVFHAGTWFNTDRWHELNPRREMLVSDGPARLCIWLNPEDVSTAMNAAPDIWSWRAGQFEFIGQTEKQDYEFVNSYDLGFTFKPISERVKRYALICSLIGEFENQLTAEHAIQKSSLLSERGDLNQTFGKLDDAAKDYILALDTLKHFKDIPTPIGIWTRIIDVLIWQNQPHQALEIIQNDVLPTINSKSTDITKARVYSRLADIHRMLEHYEEALEITLDLVLPATKKSGNERDFGITLLGVANLKSFLKQYTEALRVCEHELIPIFRGLGDKKLLCGTLSTIAGIYQATGRYDEAIQLHVKEILPYFEELGDTRFIAKATTNLGTIYLKKGDYLKAKHYLHSALYEYERMGSGEAVETRELLSLIEQYENSKLQPLITKYPPFKKKKIQI